MCAACSTLDDHPLVLSGLQRLFTAREFEVVATCTSGQEALAAIRRHRPDVAVVDIRMPGMTGLDLVRELKQEGLPTRVVLLTIELDDDQALEAARLGVRGVVLKSMASRLLRDCVLKVHEGRFWMERESQRRLIERLLQESESVAKKLTPTELKVVRLLENGAQNKEIADRLGVTESTVKNHLHALYSKLNVANRRDLMVKLREERMV